MRLLSRVALITGAGQGIGAACARRFALEGASVMLVDVNEASGSALARALGDEGHEAAFVRADVSRKSDVDAAIAATVARFARIDILVNNAGITHAAEFLDVDEKDIKPESSFIDDLGADSLGLVELVLAFEEAFEIDIPDEDTEKIRTVQDAVDYIEKNAKR